MQDQNTDPNAQPTQDTATQGVNMSDMLMQAETAITSMMGEISGGNLSNSEKMALAMANDSMQKLHKAMEQGGHLQTESANASQTGGLPGPGGLMS